MIPATVVAVLIFSHASGGSRGMAMVVDWLVHYVQTEISQQLFDELPWHFVDIRGPKKES